MSNRTGRVHAEWKETAQAIGLLAVAAAVKRGDLPRIRTRWCFDCMRQARIYHHHRGYAPEHLLDVIPVCYDCHRIRHEKEGTYRGDTVGKERRVAREALKGATVKALAKKYKATQRVIREIIKAKGQMRIL